MAPRRRFAATLLTPRRRFAATLLSPTDALHRSQLRDLLPGLLLGALAAAALHVAEVFPVDLHRGLLWRVGLPLPVLDGRLHPVQPHGRVVEPSGKRAQPAPHLAVVERDRQPRGARL